MATKLKEQCVYAAYPSDLPPPVRPPPASPFPIVPRSVSLLGQSLSKACQLVHGLAWDISHSNHSTSLRYLLIIKGEVEILQ